MNETTSSTCDTESRGKLVPPSPSLLLVLSGLVLSVGYATISKHVSNSARLTNVDLTRGDAFPDSYVMISKTQEQRCHLVDRHDSTMRRSRRNVPGKTWQFERFGADPDKGVRDHWFLMSKSKGTVFFIPVECVKDLEYPFLYDFARRYYQELDLPQVTWTKLFVNRVFHGLYLRVHLPYDLRKKDGGIGIRRELLSVRGNEMTMVDTRFNPDCRLYATCVADGKFPTLSAPSTVLAWLDHAKPPAETILLLDNVEPFNVTLLPLPVSLDRLFQQLYNQQPLTSTDERYRNWIEGRATAPASPFDASRQRLFENEKSQYRESLNAALEVDQASRPTFEPSSIGARSTHR